MTWTRAVWEIAQRQDWLITVGQATEAGLTRAEILAFVRAGRWRRLFRRVYHVHGDTVVDELAPSIVIRAGQLSVGPQAVAVLTTAARLHGMVGWRENGNALHFAVPPQAAVTRRVLDRALRVHQWDLPLSSVCHVDGLPVTTPLRTVSDVMLSASRLDAVATLDSALHEGSSSPRISMRSWRASLVGACSTTHVGR